MLDTGLTQEGSALRLKEWLGFNALYPMHCFRALGRGRKCVGKRKPSFSSQQPGPVGKDGRSYISRKPAPLLLTPPPTAFLEWRHTVVFGFLLSGTLGKLSLAHPFCSSLPFSRPLCWPRSPPCPTLQSREGKRAPCLSPGEHHGSDKDGYDPTAEP